jgi:YndJ-like protein
VNNRPDILACQRIRRHCRYSAALGVAVWWAVCFLQPPSDTWSISLLLLFVPLVLFRVAFPLLLPATPHRNLTAWYVVSYAQPPAAVLLAGSFVLPRGEAATWLAVPWLLFALFVAGLGLHRLWHTRWRTRGEWGPIAAMLLLPVGAAWAVLFQAGLRPLGLGDTLVLLTATHFHYAGFVLPVIASQLVRLTNTALTRAVEVSVIATVPLVAVGITMSQLGGPRVVELSAAWLLAAAGAVLGVALVAAARRLPTAPSVLLGVSGLSLLFALGWSGLYAAGQAGLLPGVSIPFMVTWHGAINALGFAFCGLLGWHFLATRAKATAITGR